MSRAIVSVSDKTGVVRLSKTLINNGYEIIATGGTAAYLRRHRITVTPIENITGFPECFRGRVKTIHPKVVGGILMQTEDEREAKTLDINPIDIVVVNLYPDEIDIGGVLLIRAGAKNSERVTVICDPDDYEWIGNEIAQNGTTTLQTRKHLAAKTFFYTSMIDLKIATTSGKGTQLRYGENPHQNGWFFYGKNKWTTIQGKSLSYCNILDSGISWEVACVFDDPTAVFIKHVNPCGVASRAHITKAFECAFNCDRLSAFGVIVALNRTCPASVIKKIIEKNIFIEVLVAPHFTKKALELLQKKPNIRVIKTKQCDSNNHRCSSAFGGLLVQGPDIKILKKEDLKVVTKKKPSRAQCKDMIFAWNVVKYATSNAIVFAKNQQTFGIGTGQTSRIDAVEIAAHKAKRTGYLLQGSIMASDAFFPFPDSVHKASLLGVSAIIQPGGSIRDADVIKEADKLGIAMVFSGIRAFRH